MVSAEYNRQKYHTRRALCIEKLGGVCVDCGSPKDLEFDHKDPATKSFSISRIMLHNLAKLFDELNKCELRCHICHLVKTKGDIVRAVPIHGTAYMYFDYKCRCESCKLAQFYYQKGLVAYSEVVQ